MLLHHSLILEWTRQTAPSFSHISGKLPLGWHTWKHPSLGCLFKPTTRPQWLLCCSKTVYPLMKNRWKRNVKAETIQDTYRVCEKHQEASFGFSPISSSCSAQHGSHPSDTICTQLCCPHHILTKASHIFRNWVLTCISVDWPLSATLASSWIKGEIFFEMDLTVFMCPGEIL